MQLLYSCCTHSTKQPINRKRRKRGMHGTISWIADSSALSSPALKIAIFLYEMTQKKKAIGCFLMSCLTYHSVLLLLPHLPLPHRTRSHVHLTMPCIPSLTMPPLQQVENDDPRPYRSFCSISLSLSLSCITLCVHYSIIPCIVLLYVIRA